jgi:hypothetical protein
VGPPLPPAAIRETPQDHHPGYPTYVLVDPNGKIRLYQPGADLDAIEATIAHLSNTKLTSGPWGPIPAPREILAANLPYNPRLVSGTVAYTPGGGSAIANSVSMPYAGADFSLHDEQKPETDAFNFALADPKLVTIDLKLADPTRTIDPNSPISLSFATQFAHTYERAGEPSDNTGVLVWDQNAYDPNWQQTNPNNPPGLIAYSTQNIATTDASDGSGFGFPSFRIADLTPSGYYTGLANFVQASVSFSRTQPYAASNTLQADVNNSATLSAATQGVGHIEPHGRAREDGPTRLRWRRRCDDGGSNNAPQRVNGSRLAGQPQTGSPRTSPGSQRTSSDSVTGSWRG